MKPGSLAKRPRKDWIYISQEWLLGSLWALLRESHGQKAMDVGRVYKSVEGDPVGLRKGTQCGLSPNRSQFCVDTWMERTFLGLLSGMRVKPKNPR